MLIEDLIGHDISSSFEWTGYLVFHIFMFVKVWQFIGIQGVIYCLPTYGLKLFVPNRCLHEFTLLE